MCVGASERNAHALYPSCGVHAKLLRTATSSFCFSAFLSFSPAVPPSQTAAPAPAATGLDKAFKAKGKVFFGTASDSNRFSNPTDSAVTIREFGGLTPENSMKWDAVSTVLGS